MILGDWGSREVLEDAGRGKEYDQKILYEFFNKNKNIILTIIQ